MRARLLQSTGGAIVRDGPRRRRAFGKQRVTVVMGMTRKVVKGKGVGLAVSGGHAKGGRA